MIRLGVVQFTEFPLDLRDTLYLSVKCGGLGPGGGVEWINGLDQFEYFYVSDPNSAGDDVHVLSQLSPEARALCYRDVFECVGDASHPVA